MRKILISLAALLLVSASAPALAQVNVNGTATKPVISGVTVSSIQSTSAVVSWTTDVAATSYVDFGQTDVYGNTLGDGAYVTTHSVTLLGMTAGTLYHFRVRSKEAIAGYESVSTDTTLTTAAATVNTNAATNLNANKNTNTAVNANTNTSKNVNTNKNTNANKNLNTNKNANANKNTNLNRNANINVNATNDNANDNINAEGNANIDVDTNTDVTNANVTSTTSSSDGRTGIFLIILGIVLLVGITVFAWRKARRAPTLRP